MIRIDRPVKIPSVLLSKGVAATAEHCAAFDAAAGLYQSGTLRFKFDKSIYGHPSVKSSLRAAQHDKCAFCEAKVSHIAYGDVEHFRPKGGWQQGINDDLRQPGYYWLAYEWTNLLFCCQLCNQQGKKNLFPLQRPSTRPKCHRDNLASESPLLIDPAAEDPQRHIGFRSEVAYPIRRSKRAKTSIEAFRLNRPALIEQRRDYLIPFQRLVELRTVVHRELGLVPGEASVSLRKKLAEIDSFFALATEPRSQYASMIQAAMPHQVRKV